MAGSAFHMTFRDSVDRQQGADTKPGQLSCVNQQVAEICYGVPYPTDRIGRYYIPSRSINLSEKDRLRN